MAAIVERIVAVYSLTALNRSRWEGAAFLTALLAGSWLVIRLTDIVAAIVRHRFTMRLQIERVTFIALLARIFKIFVCVVVIIALLTRAGVDVSALVTGLGIGGVAIAFAAQKTLSDLFGGISIVMRGAVRVGDSAPSLASRAPSKKSVSKQRCDENVLDRTVVTIPNSKVVEMELENFNMLISLVASGSSSASTRPIQLSSACSAECSTYSNRIPTSTPHPPARASSTPPPNAGPQIEIFGLPSQARRRLCRIPRRAGTCHP